MAVVVGTDGGISSAMSSSWRPFSGITGGVEFYNNVIQDYAAIYRTQPNVQLVVKFLARNVAQLNLKAFSRVSDTDRRSLSDHPISKWIRTPNPAIRMTRHKFLLGLMSDLGIYDNYFGLKLRNPSNGELRILRLPPELMTPADDTPWFYATKWKFLGSKSQPVFDSEHLLHVHGYNPNDSRIGLSPIEAIRQILREDMAAGQYREQFWNNGARISGVIERPAKSAGTPSWSPEAKARFEAEWHATWSGAGPRSGGTPLLEDGMMFKQISFSAKDSEYIGARRLSREEVSAQYNLSPLFVGILENANFSNVNEQHKNLYQDTLGPPLNMIQEDLELAVIPEYDDLDFDTTYIEFNIAEKLEGSFLERAAVISTAVGAPWMARNEARSMDNRPPIEGGDELIVPLNVLVGGQASPRDSAPPLGAASRGEVEAKSGRKVADDLAGDVQSWYDKHLEVLTSLFGRQKISVVSKLGSGQGVDSAWDDSRWNSELKADLLAVALEMAAQVGLEVAERFGGDFDVDQTQAYLDVNARIASENVNSTTKAQLANLDGDADDFLDSARHVFDVATSSRAEEIAISRTTQIGNFSKLEGAKQGGASTKTWRVRSAQSRHPSMDGETVPLGEKFSNGAEHPGDPSLSTDDTAGCTCDLDIEQ